MSWVRCGDFDWIGVTASLIGLDQSGDQTAATAAMTPTIATPPATASQAARRGCDTRRGGIATDSANSSAPTTRAQNGAHATKFDVRKPNADGMADSNRLDAASTIIASASARSCNWRLRRKR